MDYVLGFLFSEDEQRVALIRKNRPNWQAGKLNGIGGKVEPTDAGIHEAMTREFREETGLVVPTWDYFAAMRGDGWRVHCYRAFGPADDAKTVTDEEVAVCSSTSGIWGMNGVPNLKWLIPLALSEVKTFAHVQY